MTNQKELKTKHGNVLIVKEYLTALERRQINAIVFENVQMTMEDNKPKMNGLSANIAPLLEDAMIKQIVVSVDGKTDDILMACLNLPEEDFAELQAYIAHMASSEQKKTA